MSYEPAFRKSVQKEWNKLNATRLMWALLFLAYGYFWSIGLYALYPCPFEPFLTAK